jgi:hypothetical protein
MTQNLVPNTYFLEDAANLARSSLLARLDPNLAYQPFFRLDLGLEIPEAKHASWDYCGPTPPTCSARAGSSSDW